MATPVVTLSGCGDDLASEWRSQRGLETWVVSCRCGAGDDDGERMVACDGCGIWMHTRCGGIDDADPPPSHFICERCS